MRRLANGVEGKVSSLCGSKYLQISERKEASWGADLVRSGMGSHVSGLASYGQNWRMWS